MKIIIICSPTQSLAVHKLQTNNRRLIVIQNHLKNYNCISEVTYCTERDIISYFLHE